MSGPHDVVKGLSSRQRRGMLVVPIAVLVAAVAAVIVSRRRSAPTRVAPLAPSAPPFSVTPIPAQPVVLTKRRPSRWTGDFRRLVPVAALVAVVFVVYVAGQSEPAPVVGPTPAASPTISPAPSPNSSSCSRRADEPFAPSRITVPGVVRDARVLGLPRDSNEVPGVPPTTAAGRWQFGWDRPPGIKPGSAQGNVLINAHTFPDGSALGNKFLADLDEGDRIIIRGDGATLCYKVDRRIEVLASSGYPPYYDREGPPQIALLVCSGKRLGPGNWTHRTIWFASPE